MNIRESNPITGARLKLNCGANAEMAYTIAPNSAAGIALRTTASRLWNIITLVVFALLALMASATTANAATFSASSSGTACGGYFDTDTSTNGNPIFTSGSTALPDCLLSSFARVGQGFMSTKASGDLDEVAQGGAFAAASISEQLTISTPPGADPLDVIPVAVVFSTDALLFCNAPTNTSGAGIAISRHRLSYSLNGFNPGAGGSTSDEFLWEATDDINNGNGNSVTVTPGLIVSNTVFIAPIGGLTLTFGVETDFQGFVGQSNPGVDGFADASSTASLATTGPAIILPAGFLVNSPALGIVDNHWIDPRIDDTDGDGVLDDIDNCLLISNADQRDTNGDGYGNICDPDLNNDGIVNPIDLGLIKQSFFAAGEDLDADFNGDDAVNPSDLGILKSFFFSSPGPSAVAQ